MIRIGHGYDVHAFGGSSPLILGGVTFDGHIGLLAHSDGDVVIHAICDALLGAIGLGDIGTHFPDTDESFKDIDSRNLLRQVALLVSKNKFSINNLDVTVIAQTPKMSPNIPQIKSLLCADLNIKMTQLNVKATTTEKLGYIGRKEGIAVHCVCLVTAENHMAKI